MSAKDNQFLLMKHTSTNLFSTLLVSISLLIRFLIFYFLNHAPKRLFRKLNKSLIKDRIELSTCVQNNSFWNLYFFIGYPTPRILGKYFGSNFVNSFIVSNFPKFLDSISNFITILFLLILQNICFQFYFWDIVDFIIVFFFSDFVYCFDSNEQLGLSHI